MLDELADLNIDLQSFLLLKEGIKPVIRVGMTDLNEARKAEKYAKKLGIEMLVKKFNNMYGKKSSKPFILVYYSNDKKMCGEAWQAENNGDRIELGRLLGYPECCVEAFIRNLTECRSKDYTMMTLANVKTKPSFYCNNIFVFDSKLSSFNTQTFNDNVEIFDANEARNLFLIRHVPCSYDCIESIKIGKTTLRLLEESQPDLAKKIINALKRPVIYWNYFEWLILNGKMETHAIKYDGLLKYESLVSKNIRKMFETGNNTEMTGEEIFIRRGNDKIGSIRRNGGIPLIIDFT
jgi:hypothetical protein